MRLDHLLSKEHLASLLVQAHARDVRSRGGARGWNADFWLSVVVVRCLVQLPCGGVGTGRVVGVFGRGALLGPEGTGLVLLSRCGGGVGWRCSLCGPAGTEPLHGCGVGGGFAVVFPLVA